MTKRFLLLVCFFLGGLLWVEAQNITIVSSGGEAAGTNWTFNGNTITATADVSIDSSLINAHLNAGNDLKITTAGNINVNTLIRRTVANSANDSLVLESTAGSIYLGSNITCTQSGQFGYMAITLSAANINLTANCTLQSNAGTINIGASSGTGNVNGNYDFKVDAYCDNNPNQPLRRISAPVNFYGSAGATTALKSLNIVQSLGIGKPLLLLDGGTYKTTGAQTYNVAGLMSGGTLVGGIVLGQSTSITTTGGNVTIGNGETIVTSKSNGNHSLTITTTNLNTTSPFNDGSVSFKCSQFGAPTNYAHIGDVTITTYDGTGTPGDFNSFPTNQNADIAIKGNFTYLGRHFILGQFSPQVRERYVTINTNPTNSGNSGSVNLYNPATQSAIVGPTFMGVLRILTKTNSGTAGDISIGRTVGAASSIASIVDSSLNQVNLDASGSVASGTINLFGNLYADNLALEGQLNANSYTQRGISILGGQIKLMNENHFLKVSSRNYPSGPLYLKGQIVSGHVSNVTNLITHSTTDSLYSGTTINTGGDVTIWATKFVNRAGSDAIVVPAGKTWRVWSYNSSPFNGSTPDVRGNIPFDYKQYNALYDTTAVKGTGNGVLYKYAPALTVSLTGAVTKTYDGNTTASLSAANYSISGTVDVDTAVVTSTDASYASSVVGSNIAVTASGLSISSVRTSNKPVYDYSLSSNTATANIGQITKAYASYPAPNTTAVSILCGSSTASLSGIVDNNIAATTVPVGATISWHTEATATDATKVANPAQVGEGDYYAAYYFSSNNTYSATNSTKVTVTKEACLELVNSCPANTVNLNNLDATQATQFSTYISAQIGAYASGANLTYHTAAAATDANKLASVAALGSGVYYSSYSTGPGNYSVTAPIHIAIQTFNNKATYYQDSDGDGYGNLSVSVEACAQPQGYVSNSTDCDDSDASINPSATEVCDGKDNDCDGQTDEGVGNTYYRDADSDGYGDASNSTTACSQPQGYVSNSTDCDDSDASINPSATEICDGKDNDCDGQTDEGVGNTYYRDADSDGFGDASNSTTACTQPQGYVSNSTDCDDTDASINPSATEVCDGKDNDCDGQTDEGVGNTYYRDADSDGYGDASNSTTACSQPQGYVSNSTDCDDSDASINPSATEICDGKDNDCDGQTDEGVGNTYYLDSDGDGYGDASNSTTACTQPQGYVSNGSDCNDTDASINPTATEVCDGKDNDCDGQTDEGVGNTYYLDSDGDGYGDASNSTTACTQPQGYVSNSSDCAPADGTKWRSATLYIDLDGDGYTNGSSLICYGATVPAGYKLTTLGVDCNDNNAAVNPGATEICGNAIDDNCNGQIDEGCVVACNFKTKSQSGWSSSSKTNPLTTAWFNSKFPYGLVIGGVGSTTRRIRFTTAAAAKAFMPNIGTAVVLTKDLLNPTKTAVKNVFAGELLALKLNAAFNVGLTSAYINAGIYKGMTVGQFIVECDKQISSVASKSSTLSALSAVCAKINGGYEDCNTGYLSCTSPTVALLGYGNSLLQHTIQLESSSILIYPNPSYSQFVIRNGNKFPLELRLLNVNGQLLQNRGKLEPGASMNVGADFIPGIYLVELIGDGTKLIKKLIKQ